jgi:uncharacterized protein DUF5675
MPLITGIPNRSEIEIHWGNFVENTRGCILVGTTRDVVAQEIFDTVAKFDQLFPQIQAAVANSGCTITVETSATASDESVWPNG